MHKFGAMLGRGEITQAVFDEYAHATKDIKHLPTYAHPHKPHEAKKPYSAKKPSLGRGFLKHK